MLFQTKKKKISCYPENTCIPLSAFDALLSASMSGEQKQDSFNWALKILRLMWIGRMIIGVSEFREGIEKTMWSFR